MHASAHHVAKVPSLPPSIAAAAASAPRGVLRAPCSSAPPLPAPIIAGLVLPSAAVTELAPAALAEQLAPGGCLEPAIELARRLLHVDAQDDASVQDDARAQEDALAQDDVVAQEAMPEGAVTEGPAVTAAPARMAPVARAAESPMLARKAARRGELMALYPALLAAAAELPGAAFERPRILASAPAWLRLKRASSTGSAQTGASAAATLPLPRLPPRPPTKAMKPVRLPEGVELVCEWVPADLAPRATWV